MRALRIAAVEGVNDRDNNLRHRDIRSLAALLLCGKAHGRGSAEVTFESIVCHRARLLDTKLNSDLACKTIRK
jgi:hypothetical protein